MGNTAPFHDKERQRKVPFKYSFSSPSISCKRREEENHTHTHTFLTSTKLISMHAHGYTQEIPTPSPCGLTAINKSINHRSWEQDPAPADPAPLLLQLGLKHHSQPGVNLTEQRGFYTILQEQSLSGIWRRERNSVTQSRKEITQPDHLPFE